MAALALSLSLLVVPLGGRTTAQALSQSCTLTVIPGSQDLEEDLANAGVVVDVYQIAQGVPKGESYRFSLLSPYDGLTLKEDMDNATWQHLAEDAAQIALDGGIPLVQGAATGEPIQEEFTPGLYLLLARGVDLDSYTEIRTDDSGTSHLVTLANSREYTYRFLPELVALPSREPDETGTVTTAGDGAWYYDLTATLKPEQSLRYGSLELVKTLETYNGSGDPATVVFEIEGTLEGETVFSDVVALTFSQAGTDRVLVEHIPVGATVTVTEVYTGASYSLQSQETQTALIQAGETASVSFVNDYDWRDNGGQGIVNHFTFQPEDGWDWEQVQ
jgi:hypothetical protein